MKLRYYIEIRSLHYYCHSSRIKFFSCFECDLMSVTSEKVSHTVHLHLSGLDWAGQGSHRSSNYSKQAEDTSNVVTVNRH